jgi:lipoyl(octanoyl) transferase
VIANCAENYRATLAVATEKSWPRRTKFRTMRWRFLLTPPLPGALNMATDEGLMARARRTGEGVVRVYSWETATISLGRHQTAIGALDRGRGVDGGVPVVRRLTGGRALVHGREITYSVTRPVADDVGWREVYRDINHRLIEALRSMQVPVQLAESRARMASPGGAPCFELPAPGELMAHGRKLVGSAQVRADGVLLQHGSILVHDDQSLLNDVAHQSVPLTPAATLVECLGREPTPAEFAVHLSHAVREAWDPDLASLDTSEALLLASPCLARYTDDTWTWRR